MTTKGTNQTITTCQVQAVPLLTTPWTLQLLHLLRSNRGGHHQDSMAYGEQALQIQRKNSIYQKLPLPSVDDSADHQFLLPRTGGLPYPQEEVGLTVTPSLQSSSH